MTSEQWQGIIGLMILVALFVALVVVIRRKHKGK
jgi:LPXTG-motif cell wall-anchored protein